MLLHGPEGEGGLSLRTISYRSKARLRKGLKIGLAVLAALALCLILFAVYLGRYVVYTPEGVRLDFGRNTAQDVTLETGAQDSRTAQESVTIEFAEPGERGEETERINGYYIDLEMLQDPGAVLEAVKELTPPCTVMIDLKGGNGSFYYTTSIDGARQAAIDISTVDAVISYLRSHGFTMVARIRTFQDTNFAENHINSALRKASGSLWVGNGFYWLDPASDTVKAYLKTGAVIKQSVPTELNQLQKAYTEHEETIKALNSEIASLRNQLKSLKAGVDKTPAAKDEAESTEGWDDWSSAEELDEKPKKKKRKNAEE